MGWVHVWEVRGHSGAVISRYLAHPHPRTRFSILCFMLLVMSRGKKERTGEWLIPNYPIDS